MDKAEMILLLYRKPNPEKWWQPLAAAVSGAWASDAEHLLGRRSHIGEAICVRPADYARGPARRSMGWNRRISI